MNCRKSEELIQNSLDGLLTTAQRGELDSHLAECEACRMAFDEYRSLSRSAKLWAAPEADDPRRADAFLASVLKSAGAAPEALPAFPTWSRIAVGVASVATLGAAWYFEPSSIESIRQLTFAVHPSDWMDALAAGVRAVPGDIQQALSAGAGEGSAHLPLTLIAAGAMMVNAMFMARAYLESRRGKHGPRRAHG